MDIHANEFLASMLYLNNFCLKAQVMSFPTIKLHFKNQREFAYFKSQFLKDWQLEMGIMPYNELTKFQMLGFEIELIIDGE